LDTAFESWGEFRIGPDAPTIHGHLTYEPTDGISLHLVENPGGREKPLDAGTALPAIQGQLVDGSYVTLLDTIILSSYPGRMRYGSPTMIVASEVLFGRHVADIESLQSKRYSMELSSLANWTCSDSIATFCPETETMVVPLTRLPKTIEVALPDKRFTVQIRSGLRTSSSSSSFKADTWSELRIEAQDTLPVIALQGAARQFQNLLSLLIGHPISINVVSLTTPGDKSPMFRIFKQEGGPDHPAVDAPEMMLPYKEIREEFPRMVLKWFSRSEQARLATDVFFASQSLESSYVSVRFLFLLQAADSYHHSRGGGKYMDATAYASAMNEFEKHIPKSIVGGHRDSIKKRLEFGNQYSLPKRLGEMLDRIPENARLRIAGNAKGFATKLADTRNYFTHLDLGTKKRSVRRRKASYYRHRASANSNRGQSSARPGGTRG
jgi:hypothetical protein